MNKPTGQKIDYRYKTIAVIEHQFQDGNKMWVSYVMDEKFCSGIRSSKQSAINCANAFIDRLVDNKEIY